MNTQRRRKLGGGLLALLVCSGGFALADVSTFINPETGTISGIILGRIIEDPDPVENSIWEMIRPHHYAMLNPHGAVGDRTDGTPEIVRLGDGTAIAFWDYGVSDTDRDIVMSRWSAEGWTPIEWVSDSPELEFEPRATMGPDETIHLAWWVRPFAGSSRDVRYNALTAAGEWGVQEIVVSGSDPAEPQNLGHAFRHVDVALNGGNLFFAYEVTDAFSGRRWIEIAKRMLPEQYVRSELFELGSGPESSELGLHHVGDTMWMEWRVDDAHFAYSVFEGGGWSPPTELELADTSWIGVEQLRIEIRRAVVDSQLSDVRGPSSF